MRTHILLTLIAAFILTACASRETASIKNDSQEYEYSKYEGQSGRVR